MGYGDDDDGNGCAELVWCVAASILAHRRSSSSPAVPKTQRPVRVFQLD